MQGKAGNFRLEVACYVVKLASRNGIIKDMDVDFDRDRTEREAPKNAEPEKE